MNIKIEKDKDDMVEKELNEIKMQNHQILNSINIMKIKKKKKNKDELNLNNFCPICGNFSNFKDGGIVKRKSAQCPYCKSLERHRSVHLLFSNLLFDFINKDIKFLHFAPETIQYNFFKTKNNIDYYPVDLDPERYIKKNIKIRNKVDMQDIPYEDKYFDIIFNSHVLEHVPDDIKGMSELYRVLKDDGICITLVPFKKGLEKTYENKEYNTPELRKKHFGQEDHVRRYGKDFKERLESVGFKVHLITYSELNVTQFEREMYNLQTDPIYLCTK